VQIKKAEEKCIWFQLPECTREKEIHRAGSQFFYVNCVLAKKKKKSWANKDVIYCILEA
jgi:hypothetical protein